MLSRLYTLLLVLLVAVSSWVLFRPIITVASLSILFIYAIIFGAILSMAKSWRAFLTFVLCLLLLGMTIMLLLPAVCCAREAARCVMCRNNMMQIALALLNYESQYKCFPPPYINDKNGKPMHSWRVLILPFMEQSDLFGDYNFNEPWDGPNNKMFLARRPKVFACPDDRSALETTTTNYLVVVGKNAAFHNDGSVSLSDLEQHDRSTNTIMLIEKANSGIQWTEPRDFCLDDLDNHTSQIAEPLIHSPHQMRYGYFYHDSTGINVAFADGQVDFLSIKDYTASELERLLAINGCKSGDEPRINWLTCAALPVWLISVALLLHCAVRHRKAKSENEKTADPASSM